MIADSLGKVLGDVDVRTAQHVGLAEDVVLVLPLLEVDGDGLAATDLGAVGGPLDPHDGDVAGNAESLGNKLSNLEIKIVQII